MILDKIVYALLYISGKNSAHYARKIIITKIQFSTLRKQPTHQLLYLAGA